MEDIKYFLKLAIIITFIGTVIFEVFPNTLISWFTTSQETINLGVIAFRVLGIGLIFGGCSLVISATFQSFGEGNYSLIITLCRKIIITLPLIYLLKGIFGVSIVWWATIIAEIITTIVAIILLKKALKRIQV